MSDSTKKTRPVMIAGFATTALLVAAVMFSPATPTVSAGTPGTNCSVNDESYCAQQCYEESGGTSMDNVCVYDSDGDPTCICC